jgi:hypothetical protein
MGIMVDLVFEEGVHLRALPFDGKGWAIGSGTVTKMPVNDLYFYFYKSVVLCQLATNVYLTCTPLIRTLKI